METTKKTQLTVASCSELDNGIFRVVFNSTSGSFIAKPIKGTGIIDVASSDNCVLFNRSAIEKNTIFELTTKEYVIHTEFYQQPDKTSGEVKTFYAFRLLIVGKNYDGYLAMKGEEQTELAKQWRAANGNKEIPQWEWDS